MKNSKWRLIVALSVLTLGCGEGSPAAPPPPPPPSDPTIFASGDNWSFRLDGFMGAPAHTITAGSLLLVPTYGSSAPLVALEGAFNVSAGSVTAVLQPFGRCFDWDTNRVRFRGTRSGDTIELQSQPNASQVVRITVALSSNGTIAQGSYSITGGCGGGKSGSIDGRRVDYTGIWAGTIENFATVFNLQMDSSPDGDGNFYVSGTATFSGTSCFANAQITRRGRGRIIFPDIESPSHRMELIVELWDDLSTMQVAFALTSGVCPGLGEGNGRLVRQ